MSYTRLGVSNFSSGPSVGFSFKKYAPKPRLIKNHPWVPRDLPSLKPNVALENGMVGILVSFLDGQLSGAMLVSGSVITLSDNDLGCIIPSETQGI